MEALEEGVVAQHLVATGVLFAALLLTRTVVLRLVRRATWASEAISLRWAVQVRWAILVLLVLGLVSIWSTELRSLALSVVAIAAAIVIATKELIMCVSGSILRATSRPFSIGDRVEIGAARGDVIDFGALTTTILETGPTHRRTGRAIVIPNSLLFATAVTNETVTGDYVLHTVTVPVPAERLTEAKQRLLAIASELCAAFLDEAKQHLDATARRHGLPAMTVDPIVSLRVESHEVVNLLLRVPALARDKGLLEQDILRRFFQKEG